MILKDFCCSAWQSCCLIRSFWLFVFRFPKSRLQNFVCQISLWISMISPILSCISGLQTPAKQHEGVFCQIHWGSSPSTLHAFLLLLSLSGKTSSHYVKSSKKLWIPSIVVCLIVCNKMHILKKKKKALQNKCMSCFAKYQTQLCARNCIHFGKKKFFCMNVTGTQMVTIVSEPYFAS